MTIKRFAQSNDDSRPLYWYDTSENTRFCCDEETVMKLWCHWVLNENQNSVRNDNGRFDIFEYIQPVELNINELENWAK